MRFVHPAVSVIFAIAGLSLLPACRRETPPPVPPPAPLSGWQVNESGAVAGELVGALTEARWVQEFAQTNGRPPILAIGTIDDRSADQVPVPEIEKAFTDAVATNPRLRLAGNADADATLNAVIGLRTAGQSKLFTIDARAVDAKTGEVRWFGGIERARQTPAPVLPAPAAK